jgi:hypothetical protein
MSNVECRMSNGVRETGRRRRLNVECRVSNVEWGSGDGAAKADGKKEPPSVQALRAVLVSIRQVKARRLVGRQTANRNRQPANGKPQTANGKRQTANRKRQTANGKPQTANRSRQTANRQSANAPTSWSATPDTPHSRKSLSRRGGSAAARNRSGWRRWAPIRLCRAS